MLADTAILPARCTIGRPHLRSRVARLGVHYECRRDRVSRARGELKYADENGGDEAAFLGGLAGRPDERLHMIEVSFQRAPARGG